MKELWVAIEGYEGLYEVSNMGRVRSLDRTVKHKDGKVTHHKSRILKYAVSKKGYCRVYPTTNRGGVAKKASPQVHRLVASAFIPNPNDYPQVNHLDSNKQNNEVSNLEWCTNLQNARHAWANGRTIKLTYKDIPIIRKLIADKKPVKEIAAMYKVSETTIYEIKIKRTWKRA